MLLLHLLACSDWQLTSHEAPMASPAVADTDADEPIADTDAPAEEDTEPPEDTGCDPEATAETRVIIGSPAVDPCAGAAVCSDPGIVDFAFTTEWSAVVPGGFAMGPIVAPNRV